MKSVIVFGFFEYLPEDGRKKRRNM